MDMAFIVDGKQIIDEMLPFLKKRIDELIALLRRQPKLGIFLVGPTASSLKFTEIKIQMSEKVGIKTERLEYSSAIQLDDLRQKIAELTKKDQRHHDGYIFQWPPPRHIGPQVLNALPDDLDVDRMGLYATNRFLNGRETVLPPLVRAFEMIISMAQTKQVLLSVKGTRAVVIGAGGGGWMQEEKEWGRVGGFPIYWWLSQMGAAVVPCHKQWKREWIAEEVKKADIVFSAVGKSEFVLDADWIKPGAVVVDGAFFHDDTTGQKRGDIIDHERVKERAAVYAPSPGGIGRMTVYMVLDNADLLIRRQRHLRLLKKG